MIGLLSIIVKNKNLFLFIVALSILGAGIGYTLHLKKNIQQLEDEKIVLMTELRVSQSSVAALQKAIDEQNVAVGKLKKDSDQLLQAGKKEVAAAKKEADKYRKLANELAGATHPANISTCDAANALINSVISNAK